MKAKFFCMLLTISLILTLLTACAYSERTIVLSTSPRHTDKVSASDISDTPTPSTHTTNTPMTSPTTTASQSATSAPLPTTTPTTASTTASTASSTVINVPQPTVPTPPRDEKRSLIGLLKTAVRPLGSTMYIWGGGWNEEDTAAGVDAVTIGVSERWAEFAARQDKNYDYNDTRYQIHDGLDCSGYVGWVVYNTLEDESGGSGYVFKSTKVAKTLSDMGFGSYTSASEVRSWRAGDIFSMKGHVWIAVGTCADGSVVLLHSSPPGVILCGTLKKSGERSQAVELAEQYMSRYYPEWYKKYPNCSRPYSYLTSSSRMRWSSDVLTDHTGLSHMSAGEVLECIFGE